MTHLLQLLLIVLLLSLGLSSKMSRVSIKQEYHGVCDDGVESNYNNHIITSSESLNTIINDLKLVKQSISWNINFVTEFMVLSTSHGSNIRGNCIDKGDDHLDFMTFTTRDYRPNLSYKFFVIDRNNFTTCNDFEL